ncbi:MAG: SWIM zinc finger family protein [Bacteroidetes bacterium]|nr:SWIM zinc finger family protein [Bacteroidota bacterium]
MLFNYKFKGDTQVSHSATSTEMNFSPDVTREPTFFHGVLNKHIPFREAVSALHDIVVSDYRFKPKDKTDYKAWAKEQEDIWLADFMKSMQNAGERIQVLRKELSDVRQEKEKLLGPFHKARRRYFDYLYKADRDMWIVLDPIITVHPDELFFECFSKDESSYGRLSCSYEVFTNINDFKCGTTNIDYSSALYDEFQKIRSYKETKFVIDPGGFEVRTSDQESFKETKIDVPESWVRGLLQVNSAMMLGGSEIELHPMDIYNICFHLKRKKEKEGPRSLRFQLAPGKPLRVIFEPWNFILECPRSVYTGAQETEVRIWGRRRLLLLERLIPVTRSFRAIFMGTGLPSFFIADMGDMSFTLGLSGWTANDWSNQGNFDLLAPRMQVDPMTAQQVYSALRKPWFNTADKLAGELNTDTKTVMSAFMTFAQSGRAMYDINKKVFRIRELSREPLDGSKLRFANEREEEARTLAGSGAVEITGNQTLPNGNRKLTGTVAEKGKKYHPEINFNTDDAVVSATCTCHYYTQNKLYKGPCGHMIALNIQYREKELTTKKLFNIF